MFDLPPLSHYFSPEHELFRQNLRDFVSREISPHINEWDESGTLPQSLFHNIASLGVTGIGFPEEYGGSPADIFYQVIVAEEMARCGSGGLQAALNSHTIGLPPILAGGSEELKRRVIPPVLRGEKFSALAVTEPSGGSDVAAITTNAVRDGDYYVVNGEKTYITSGMRADFITTAVRTDRHKRGAGGVSVLVIDGDTPGLRRTELKKMGWWCSDTAQLSFENCLVPVSNLVGAENQGFKTLMTNFNSERLFMSALAYSYAQVCVEDALDWARQRMTFGQPLSHRQVIRHKLMDMKLHVDAARTNVYELAYRISHRLGDPDHLVARIAMAKVLSTQAMAFCADQALQILGGIGFMRGTRCERIYREVKVMMIGGGSEEIMKDLASRQLRI